MIEEMELAGVTIPNTAIPQQFEHSTNPDIYRNTTVRKIWVDTGSAVDTVLY